MNQNIKYLIKTFHCLEVIYGKWSYEQYNLEFHPEV